MAFSIRCELAAHLGREVLDEPGGNIHLHTGYQCCASHPHFSVSGSVHAATQQVCPGGDLGGGGSCHATERRNFTFH